MFFSCLNIKNYFFIKDFIKKIFQIFPLFRLDVKSVCPNHIEIIYNNNLIQEVKNIEVWDRNQSEEWENGDWEHVDNGKDNIFLGLNVVSLKSLEKSHIYDVRLIGLGNDEEIIILTRDNVQAAGLL